MVSIGTWRWIGRLFGILNHTRRTGGRSARHVVAIVHLVTGAASLNGRSGRAGADGCPSSQRRLFAFRLHTQWPCRAHQNIVHSQVRVLVIARLSLHIDRQTDHNQHDDGDDHYERVRSGALRLSDDQFDWIADATHLLLVTAVTALIQAILAVHLAVAHMKHLQAALVGRSTRELVQPTTLFVRSVGTVGVAVTQRARRQTRAVSGAPVVGRQTLGAVELVRLVVALRTAVALPLFGNAVGLAGRAGKLRGRAGGRVDTRLLVTRQNQFFGTGAPLLALAVLGGQGETQV